MNIINHGTLQDFIDYKALINAQANTQRVVKSRKRTKVNNQNKSLKKKMFRRITY